jgi:peptidoglycan hydrolase-like protein with peptidoglycan-binding domain
MVSSWSKGALGVVIVIALSFPAWAIEKTTGAPAKEQTAKHRVVMSRQEVRKVQEALKEKGENPGALDGIMGKKTHAAISAFQKSNGLKVTARLDSQTAEKLGVQKPKEEK